MINTASREYSQVLHNLLLVDLMTFVFYYLSLHRTDLLTILNRAWWFTISDADRLLHLFGLVQN